MRLPPIPAWVRRLVAAVTFGVGAFIAVWRMGRAHGVLGVRAKNAEKNLKAAKEAKDIKHDLEIGDDQRLVDILTGGLHKTKR